VTKKTLTLLIFLVLSLLLSSNAFQRLQNAPKTLLPSPTAVITPSNSLPLISNFPTNSAVLGTEASESATVLRVVDGDTIELSDKRKLRYIGINTPETVDPRRGVQCYGHEASDFNKQLVTGKTVYLEKDVSETDRYGRLLRYVYLEDGQMVNELLVKEGYAYASAYPPDVKYQDRFNTAQQEARTAAKGLWSSCPLPTTKR
jgi:micrococcal nuclease